MNLLSSCAIKGDLKLTKFCLCRKFKQSDSGVWYSLGKCIQTCLRKACLKVIMAAPISTHVLVEAIKEPQPKFKMHPMKVGEIEMTSALSFMPFGILLVEDICSYIHCKLEELGDNFI